MASLEATILKAMATDSSDLYEPRLATALSGNTADSEKPKPKLTPKPKPKGDPNGSGNGNRKKGTSGAAPDKPKGTQKRHKKKGDDKEGEEGGDKEQPEGNDDEDDPTFSGNDEGDESHDQ